jgi:hypothetical protein
MRISDWACDCLLPTYGDRLSTRSAPGRVMRHRGVCISIICNGNTLLIASQAPSCPRVDDLKFLTCCCCLCSHNLIDPLGRSSSQMAASKALTHTRIWSINGANFRPASRTGVSFLWYADIHISSRWRMTRRSTKLTFYIASNLNFSQSGNIFHRACNPSLFSLVEASRLLLVDRSYHQRTVYTWIRTKFRVDMHRP